MDRDTGYQALKRSSEALNEDRDAVDLVCLRGAARYPQSVISRERRQARQLRDVPPLRPGVEGARDERSIDFVTANGENVAGGMGLTPSTADSILAAGVDVITSGNHIWDKREIYQYLESSERVLRPLNYGTHEVPGRGWGTYQALDGTDLAVINLQGRTYMQPIDNPFTDVDRLLDESSEPLPPVRLVDFHCELTSEKNALGLYLDGRVSVVAGTHTHIVTGDERILPNGTAYQTDLGMTGPIWSVIGFDPKTVIPRFLNALPTRFEVASGTVVFNALQVDIDPATGRALAIERIQRLVEA